MYIVYIVILALVSGIQKLTDKFSDTNTTEEQKELKKELVEKMEGSEFKTPYINVLGIGILILTICLTFYFYTIFYYLLVVGIVSYMGLPYIFWKIKIREIRKEYNQKIDELYPDEHTKIWHKRITLIGNIITSILLSIVFLITDEGLFMSTDNTNTDDKVSLYYLYNN